MCICVSFSKKDFLLCDRKKRERQDFWLSISTFSDSLKCGWSKRERDWSFSNYMRHFWFERFLFSGRCRISKEDLIKQDSIHIYVRSRYNPTNRYGQIFFHKYVCTYICGWVYICVCVCIVIIYYISLNFYCVTILIIFSFDLIEIEEDNLNALTTKYFKRHLSILDE